MPPAPVLAGSIAYSLLRSPKQQRVATLTYRPGMTAPAAPLRVPPAPNKTGSAPAATATPGIPGAATTGKASAPGIPGAVAPGKAAAPGIPGAAAGIPGATAPGKAPAAAIPGTGSAAVPAGKGAAPGSAAPAKGGQSQLHLALLEREQPRFTGFRRNIFAPIFQEEVKLPPFKPLPPPPRPVVLPPPPPPVAVAPALPQQEPADAIAAREMAKFTFLGFLQKGEKTVFLSRDNDIFMAKKGSRLGPNYEVSALSDEALTIRSVADGRELVIPLQDHKPLRVKR